MNEERVSIDLDIEFVVRDHGALTAAAVARFAAEHGPPHPPTRGYDGVLAIYKSNVTAALQYLLEPARLAETLPGVEFVEAGWKANPAPPSPPR